MYRLLIVEDEPVIRMGLKKYFDWSSFHISTILEARNGKEGLSMTLGERPDLIITDIRMPEMNGLDMIKAIQDEQVDTEIIILTGHNEFSYAQQAIRYGGVRDFLIKPLQYEESYQSITKCMEIIQAKTPPEETIREMTEDQLFEQIEAYIQENITGDTSLQAIAEHFFYNPSYLSRLFKSTLSLNYTEFVRNIKITIAKKYLEDPQLNIQDIAKMSGFSTYKQFSQVFRTEMHMTPTDFRRSLRM